MKPELIIKQSALDYELCELLGEKPSDFIVLLADGEQVPFFGTPFDTPQNRRAEQLFVDSINDRTKKSSWPEFFRNWRRQFGHEYKLAPEATAADYHPQFSWAISRVCAGYAGHMHVAIGVFEKLGTRVKSWVVEKTDDGVDNVEIVSATGVGYRESGFGMARLIAQAAKRLLRDLPNTEVTRGGAADVE